MPLPSETASALPATTTGFRRSPLGLILGCGIVAALLCGFVLTVGLVIYSLVKPREQTASNEPASTAVRENTDSPRLLGEREPRREGEEPPTDPPAANPTGEIRKKSLASLDRLDLKVGPMPADDTPTPAVWDGHSASIRGVAYTDDGRFVVSVSGAIEKDGKKEDNSIRVWDARRGRQVHKLDNFREALDAVSVSPGGRFAVFGHGGHYEGGKWVDSVDHRVHLWDIQDNKEFFIRKSGTNADSAEARFAGLDSSVFGTAFSPDRQTIVGVSNSGKTVVWEAQSGKVLVSQTIEAVARLRTDTDSGVPARLTLSGIHCIRFTPDNRWLLAAGGDYTVRLLDAASGEQLHSFESHQDIVWAAATMQTKDGQLLGLSGGGSRQRLKEAGFVPGARDYAIRLWDLQTRREIRRFLGHEQDVLSLAFCPNGRHFLSAGQDRTVRLWDVASGKMLRTYRGHTDRIRSVAVSPDGRSAVSGGDDCTLRYWRLPATAEDVILALDRNSRSQLADAVKDLDSMGSELRSAAPKLLRTACQKDKAMAELALRILRQLGPAEKQWVNGLREMLVGPLAEGRPFAAEALVQLGSDALPALAELRKALSDEDVTVRRNAVTALANLGTEAREAAEELGQRVEQDTDSDVKMAAIQALGRIDGKATLQALFGNVRDAAVLTAVLDALTAANGLDRGMVNPLLNKGLSHENAGVRGKSLDSLERVGKDTVPLKTLVTLSLDDADAEVRKRAAKLLTARMSRLTDADLPDVRALLDIADKPQAVQIGLQAVQKLGSKARVAFPELLKRLSAAEGDQKLEMALALVAIDAGDKRVADATGPLLVAALRPKTIRDKPSEAVLKALAAIGEPVVEDVFKALAAADDRGTINANNRKALFVALQRIGRKAYSETNVQTIRGYQKKELYRDVREEAGKAIRDMLPP